MTTKDLIDAALNAQTVFDQARSAAQTAAANLSAAQAALTQANQALHDDLDSNGPAAIVDATTTPPTVTLYEAVDPDSWSATILRVAA